MNTECKGLNRQHMKERNRGKILQMIATDTCNTRIDLSKATGLSKMAVTNIVSELMNMGIVEESEKDPKSGQGRNPVKLKVAHTAPKIVGLLVFRGYCEAVLCNMDLTVICRERRTMEHVSQENFISFIYELLDSVMREEKNVIGIGVASIGPINSAEGMILAPYYFYDIHDVPIVKMIQDRFQLPVFFDHDNQSGVLAEQLFGHGKGYKDILLLGVSEGVGCGIISDNDLYSNRNGLSPELGHVSIDYNGVKCLCGNRGCLETYIRTPRVLDKLHNVTGKQYSYQQFCDLAREDADIHKIFMDAVEKMAIAIVNGLNILNSEVVLLGYDCIYWSEDYVRELEKQINDRKFSSSQYRVKVKKAQFGIDAQLMGAVCNVATQVFKGNLLFNERV